MYFNTSRVVSPTGSSTGKGGEFISQLNQPGIVCQPFDKNWKAKVMLSVWPSIADWLIRKSGIGDG